MTTYNRLVELGLRYEPDTGFLMKQVQFSYGRTERRILSDRYKIDGVHVAVTRIAWMVHHKCDLK